MKQLIAFLCLVFSYTAYAQNSTPDKIQKKDKTVVDAIVTEVSKTEIQYKKFSSPNGATFTMPTTQVSSIVYANGYIDIIDDAALAENTTKVEAPTTVSPETPVAVVKESKSSEPSSKSKKREKEKTNEKNKTVEASNEVTSTSEAKEEATEIAASTSKKEKKEKKTETIAQNEVEPTSENKATTVSSAPRKRKGLSGKETGVELPAKEFTGLDIYRIPKDQLQKDIRNPEEYAGEYQWKSSNKGGRETAWLIEWDNITLIPKEWMGYGWRMNTNTEKGVKLKGNELRASGDLIGYFVKFEHNGKEVRGLQIKTKNDQELFLVKVN